MSGVPNLVLYGRGERPVDGAAMYQKIADALWLPTDTGRSIGFALIASRRIKVADGGTTVVHTHGSVLDAAALRAAPKGALLYHSLHGCLAEKARVVNACRILLPSLDGIFVVSRAIERQLRRFLSDAPPIHVLPSGIDNVFFTPAPAERTKRLLLAGRLNNVKGFDLGLHAASILAKRGIIEGVDVVGDGPERNSLVATARKLGLQTQFHGHLSKPDVAERMRRAAVLLLPSRSGRALAEGSPTVILEAWASGLPIAASDSGGIPDLIRDGRDAMLAPEEDVLGLACAAAAAIANREHLVRAGTERARQHTWNSVAQAAIAIYRSDVTSARINHN